MSKELKACPLCSQERVFIETVLGDSCPFAVCYFVRCVYCGLNSGHCGDRKAAIKRWNTRPESSPAQEWISVEDRLPEEDSVIVFAENYAIPFEANYHNGVGFFTSSEAGRAIHSRVTHWQPLPTPPKSNARLAVEAVDGTESEVDYIPPICIHCDGKGGYLDVYENNPVQTKWIPCTYCGTQPQPPEGV